jgi:hypothetical protein
MKRKKIKNNQNIGSLLGCPDPDRKNRDEGHLANLGARTSRQSMFSLQLQIKRARKNVYATTSFLLI